MGGSISTVTTAAACWANSAVNEPVPVPTSSTTSSRPIAGRLEQQPQQVQVDQKVLAELGVRPDARLLESLAGGRRAFGAEWSRRHDEDE